MTARPGKLQATYAAGELAPILHERKDLKYYHTGAKTMRNVEVLPQGGFRQAPGTRQVAALRKRLIDVSIASATLTAPNGGTAANIRDGATGTLLTTNSINGAGPHVLVTITFAAATAVAAVDISNFLGAFAGEIAVEYQSGADWIEFAGRKALATVARNRRFTAPPLLPVTASAWRIVARNLAGAGAVSIGEVAMLAEDTAYSNVRLRPFTSADGAVYDMAFTTNHADVIDAAGWRDGVASLITGAQVPAMKAVQSLDTMLTFHPDRAPSRIMRQGSDTEWHGETLTLDNLPNHDYGAVYNNGVAAKWALEFVGFTNPANIAFTLTLSGEETEGIKVPSTLPSIDYDALADSIKTALEALGNVAAGISVEKVDAGQIAILFTGAGNDTDKFTVSMNSVPAAPEGSGVTLLITPRKIVPGGPQEPALWVLDFSGFEAVDPTDMNFSIAVTDGGAPETTTDIALPVNPASPAEYTTALVPTIKAALEKLTNVKPGLTVTKVEVGKIHVEFTGKGNEGDDWALAGSVLNRADAAVIGYKEVTGVAPGEAIMSTARGWPRCGRILQQRLLLGGLKGVPNVWMASVLGDFFNFDTRIAAANGAMLVPMDTDGNEAIEDILATRSPLILTSQAEYWLADRAISKDVAPNHVQASRNGVAAGIPVIENEGAAIFINANRGVVSEFRYNEVDQNFVTQNLSLLGSHLVEDVRDQAIQRATKHNDAQQLQLVLDSGEMRVFALLREQEVTAGLRRTTAGSFLACAVNGANQVTVACRRTVTGFGNKVFIERFEHGLLLDQAVTKTLDPASKTVTGLDDLEGQEVWAIADDDVLGPFTVAGGRIADLGQSATTVTVGRWSPPYAETLPPPRDIGPRIVLERRARIHTVRVSVMDTTSLAVGANGGRIYNVPLFRFGQEMDKPSLQNKFTGTVVVQGLTGYHDAPTVVITQTFPGLLTVRGIVVEAAL